MKRALVATSILVLALAGCTSNETLAGQYQNGSGQGYISGDGSTSEIPAADRGEPIKFSGTTADGDEISSDSLAGSVHVVNFWYASCPPCRAEADDLAAISTEYSEVPFVGVNIFDGADVAALFEKKYDIAYPSILDAKSAAVQLAFAKTGAVAPNAVPTTVVIDHEGRVAARISGRIASPDILAAMIDTVVAESP